LSPAIGVKPNVPVIDADQPAPEVSLTINRLNGS
jgi:hypothetical protein